MAENIDYIRALLAKYETAANGTKVLDAATGWLFLINDRNKALHWLFGSERWTEEELTHVRSEMRERIEFFKTRNIRYCKFIIPDKAAIYKTELPDDLRNHDLYPDRPAVQMSRDFPENVFYFFEDIAVRARIEHLFYRGDTHLNTLGAHLAYRLIVEKLNAMGANFGAPLKLSDLLPVLAQYDGDLFNFLAPEKAQRIRDRNASFHGAYGFEVLAEFHLPDELNKARLIENDMSQRLGFDQPTLVYKNDSREYDTIVFRTSMAENMHRLFAQHFRKSVFVYHRGHIIPDVIETEKPHIVIDIMSERLIPSYRDRKALKSMADGDTEKSEANIV